MVCDVTGNMGRVTSCLHVSPSVVAGQRISSWAHQFIRADLTKQLQVKLIQRVDASFSDVKTTEDKELLIKDEARMVATSIWLLAHEAQLNPIAYELSRAS